MYKGEISRAAYDQHPGERWSRLKNLRKSALHYQHALKHAGPDTDALRMGGAIHCALLEPEFFASRYVTYAGDKCKGEGARKAWAEFQAAHSHMVILSADEWTRAHAVAAAVRSHSDAGQLLAKGRAEVPLTWTDERTGIACKCRLDWVTPKHQTVEIKSALNIEQHSFANMAWKYGYFHQVEYYDQGLAAQLGTTSEDIESFIVAVESSPPYDVCVFCPDSESMYAAREELGGFLAKLKECRALDRWPGRYAERTFLTAPRYVLDSEDDEWDVQVKE